MAFPFPEAAMKRLALMLVLLAFPSLLVAQIQPHFSEQQCFALAQIMGDAAMYREAGANVDKHFALLTKDAQGVDKTILNILERELRRVYTGSDSAEAVYGTVLERCLKSGGTMGTDV